jgi:UDP-N-acetylmuramate dehydrogenase
MHIAPDKLVIESNVPISTWFKIGGCAERFCAPETVHQLQAALVIDPDLRVLGDGANLLVDDDGVPELVVSLRALAGVSRDEQTGIVTLGAGVNLFKFLPVACGKGWGGMEGLGGIPASIGGAVMMNAGGRFGEIGDSVVRVHAVDRTGRMLTLERKDIPFSYRHSGLEGLIVTSVEVLMPQGDPTLLRAKLKDVMKYKADSQPMSAQSAGCCFKNPTLTHDVDGIGSKGQRVSAGMLIDRAGLKGLVCRGASVSMVHGNFLVTDETAKARDVIELMNTVAARVKERFGIEIQREVVVWSRHS